MKEINILFLSSGNRVELIKEFKMAKEELNINGEIHTLDLDEYAPTLYFSDKKGKISPIGSENYIEDLKKYCIENKISLIIPLIEKELEILSEYKEEIEKETNSRVLVSDKNVIEIARNKYKTEKFLRQNGFDTPKIINDLDIIKKNYTFPLFIKPFNGSGSVENFKINNEKELEFFKEYVSNPIIQEFIDGQEYCVDVFSDLNKNPITIVIKERIEHFGGSISKAKVIKDNDILLEIKKLVDTLGPIGEINIDCIKKDGKVYIIEINARFPGGPPLSFRAGANSAKNIYKILNGETLKYVEDYEYGLKVVRFNDSIFIK